MADQTRLAASGYLLTLWIFTATPAVAQTACPIPVVAAANEAVDRFDDLRRDGCLGGSKCESSECKLVASLSAGAEPKSASPIQMQNVLDRLNQASASISEDQAGAAQLHGMQARWNLEKLAKADPKSALTQILSSQPKLDEWRTRNFLVFQGTQYEIDAQAALSQCNSQASCQAAFNSIISVYSMSTLIWRTLSTATREQLDQFDRYIHQQDARWTAFHDKSLAVLPWELAFNNLFYRAAKDGFSGPPNYQWLLLHPSAALAYDTRQSDKLQPALLLDVIGRYQWTWGGATESDITKPYGIALAMSWHGNGPGYGLAVHLPHNWSIGVTTSHGSHGGSQVQLIVSAEVARFVTDKEKDVQDLRTKLEALK